MTVLRHFSALGKQYCCSSDTFESKGKRLRQDGKRLRPNKALGIMKMKRRNSDWKTNSAITLQRIRTVWLKNTMQLSWRTRGPRDVHRKILLGELELRREEETWKTKEIAFAIG